MEELLPLLSPLVSALVAVFGAYQAVKRAADERERKYAESIARLETKVDVLSERVEKHNNLVERMGKAEVEINNLYHRYDEMKIGGTE
jgi:hypothetical protein